MAQSKTGGEKTVNKEPLLIAAIDFGTTYSGSAYSFRHDYIKNPTKIYAREWSGGSLMSAKAPTCVLIKPDGKTLDAFGFDAEDRYTELAAENKHHHYYFFKHFKMLLFDKVNLKRNIMLDDVSGKQLSAKTVFAIAIKFLKDDLMRMSEKRIATSGLRPCDVHWVLTVPAIWNDAAKQFMREAATDPDFGAIPDDMLTIALEPEAASLYCRHLPVQQKTEMEEVSVSEFEAGTKYMVVDAGGGTVDISVHQVKEDSTLRELYNASGGAWGGTNVDQAFNQFNVKLVGQDVWTKFKQNHMEDYVDMCRDWEVKKRKIEPGTDTKVTLRMPISLSETFSDETGTCFKQAISNTGFAEKVEFKGDKLRVNTHVLTSFFSQSVGSVVKHMTELLQDPHAQGVLNILLVGGYSECKILQAQVKEAFPNKNVIIPDDAGLAVLKGAVIFGHSPRYISERIVRLTYGVGISVPFVEGKHPLSKRYIKDNKVLCNNVFDKHVTIGQSVKFNEAQSEETYWAEEFEFALYSSTDTAPEYTTDGSCRRLGIFHIDSLATKESGLSKNITIRIYFGRAELELEVEIVATGDIKKIRVDCM